MEKKNNLLFCPLPCRPYLPQMAHQNSQWSGLRKVPLSAPLDQPPPHPAGKHPPAAVSSPYYPGKGKEYAEKLRDYTITLYKKCAAYALEKGIIIADTKFEFGLDENGNITIGDEMLTPDSSRFWPAEGYEPGHGPVSYTHLRAHET